MAKAVVENVPDGEGRNPGEQNRIRYPSSPGRKRCPLSVALATSHCGAVAKAINGPLGKYGRKTET